MRSSCCLCVFLSPPFCLKAGIVEPEETVISRQRLGKYFVAAMNTHATVDELLDAMIFMRSVTFQTFYM
jgi:hypothetical protein